MPSPGSRSPASSSAISSVDRTGLAGDRVVPGLEDLQEDPLRPAVERRVGGGDPATLVMAQPQPAQLLQEDLDVAVGGGTRVLSGLHRVLLGRQAERVEAHRVQHVRPAHAQVARIHVGADVTQRVADVQARPGRVREHVHHVGVRPDRHPVEPVGERTGRVRRVEGAVLGPPRLPGGLDLVGGSPPCSGRPGRRRPRRRWCSSLRAPEQGLSRTEQEPLRMQRLSRAGPGTRISAAVREEVGDSAWAHRSESGSQSPMESVHAPRPPSVAAGRGGTWADCRALPTAAPTPTGYGVDHGRNRPTTTNARKPT